MTFRCSLKASLRPLAMRGQGCQTALIEPTLADSRRMNICDRSNSSHNLPGARGCIASRIDDYLAIHDHVVDAARMTDVAVAMTREIIDEPLGTARAGDWIEEREIGRRSNFDAAAIFDSPRIGRLRGDAMYRSLET